jgi:hypothetical protein
VKSPLRVASSGSARWETGNIAEPRAEEPMAGRLDRARAGLPIAIAVSIAVVDPLGAAFAMASACQPLDLQLDQTLGRKTRSSRAARRCRNSSSKVPGGSSCPWSSSGPRFG